MECKSSAQCPTPFNGDRRFTSSSFVVVAPLELEMPSIRRYETAAEKEVSVSA